MTSSRVFAWSTVALGVLALGHALLSWPLDATIVFFGGGAFIAFFAEAAVINAGWLEHHIGPKLLGVPLYLLPGWTGAVYVSFRFVLLGTSGWLAVFLAALLATTYDLMTDHRGVSDGHWTYTDDIPGPRYRDVPWWNYVGWLAISGATAGLAVPFL